MQKVIFLDIDGVMNSNVFYEQRHRKRWLKSRTYYYLIRKFLGIKSKGVNLANHKTPAKYYTYEFQLSRLIEETCPKKWKWLSNFCNETGTKICISSVWRYHFGREKEVIPSWWERALVDLGFNEGTFVGITGRMGMRGEEIKEWLDKNPKTQDYAILDDDSDMLPEQMDKFYHCDGYFGLSPNHLYRIGRAFLGKSNYGHLNKTISISDTDKKPDPRLINSMAMRYTHDFGFLDENRKESIRTTMRQLWEEVVGLGFYKEKL